MSLPMLWTAKLFVMDYATGKVEKEVSLKLTTDKKTQYYAGEVKFAPSGELMVATQKTLLFVEPATLKINKEIKTVIGEKKINVNGQEIGIDVAAFTDENDRTLLPLRAFVENGLGKTIFWQETGVDQGLIVIADDKVLDTDKDKAVIDKIISYFES